MERNLNSGCWCHKLSLSHPEHRSVSAQAAERGHTASWEKQWGPKSGKGSQVGMLEREWSVSGQAGFAQDKKETER